ncbi:hypothetical protein FNF29_04909 [Cafeteria roenbergensis]|uniref:Ste24 endopeptidase n=1 Tax=Cafeteria roenbergensis TaxID=33653 RepID=A0A5A8CE97_CAFRO|nr:hypothetical protein FNF29_04909 [Cafeteria roenbergensis]|eukprot:KAA0151019.1 hypothetical protein FNF29_04909 [Cafeteria roenbergensis]
MESSLELLQRTGHAARFGFATGEFSPESDAVLGATVVGLAALTGWNVYLKLRQHRLFANEGAPAPLLRAVRRVDEADSSLASEGRAAGPVLEWMDIADSTVLAQARTRVASSAASETGAKGGPGESFEERVLSSVAKAQAYGRDRSELSIIRSVVGLGTDLALVASGAMPAIWAAASQAVRAVMGPNDAGMLGDVARGVAFMGALSLVESVADWPLQLYSSFVVEQRHGFNRQTLALWAQDQLKSLAIGAAIGGPVVAGLVAILSVGGPRLPLYLWGGLATASVLGNLAYPLLIQPAFNTLEQLPAGPPRAAIEELAIAQGFSSKDIVVADGSLRSSHSNAFVIGLGPVQRITLFDSLLAHASLDETVAVVAHELGHWKLGHTLMLLGASLTQLGLMLGAYGAAAAYDELPQAAGFAAGEAPPIARLQLFLSLGLAPLTPVVGFAVALMTRTLEYQADAFAVDQGYAAPLSRALVKMSVENLSTPWVDPLYSAYFFSHPALVERLAAIEQRDARRARADGSVAKP